MSPTDTLLFSAHRDARQPRRRQAAALGVKKEVLENRCGTLRHVAAATSGLEVPSLSSSGTCSSSRILRGRNGAGKHRVSSMFHISTAPSPQQRYIGTLGAILMGPDNFGPALLLLFVLYQRATDPSSVLCCTVSLSCHSAAVRKLCESAGLSASCAQPAPSHGKAAQSLPVPCALPPATLCSTTMSQSCKRSTAAQALGASKPICLRLSA